MSDSESRNRRSRHGGSETDRVMMAKLDDHKAIKEELSRVKEQINIFHDKLEEMICKNGLLLTLNYRLMMELETASTLSTQGYKVRNLTS